MKREHTLRKDLLLSALVISKKNDISRIKELFRHCSKSPQTPRGDETERTITVFSDEPDLHKRTKGTIIIASSSVAQCVNQSLRVTLDLPGRPMALIQKPKIGLNRLTVTPLDARSCEILDRVSSGFEPAYVAPEEERAEDAVEEALAPA